MHEMKFQSNLNRNDGASSAETMKVNAGREGGEYEREKITILLVRNQVLTK